MKIEVRFLFEPRDLWVGVFWRTAPGELEVFLCLVPCLPLRLRFSTAERRLVRAIGRKP